MQCAKVYNIYIWQKPQNVKWVCILQNWRTYIKTVHEEKEEQEKEEMRYELRKTGHIDCDFSFASVDTQVSHESLQPDMDDLT